MDMQDVLNAMGNVANSIKSGMENIGQDIGCDSKAAFEGIKDKFQELTQNMSHQDDAGK